MEEYQLDRPFSLRHHSALNFSKHLWALPDIKQLTLQCIEEGKPWSKYGSTDIQNKLRNEISRKFNGFSLPESVKKDLRFVVESMGLRLQRWAIEMKTNKMFSPDLALHIDHIRWTNYGCIDTSETVRTMYHLEVLPKTINTWMEVCYLCLEDCIVDLWPKMSEMEIYNHYEYRYLMSLYWFYRFQKCLNKLSDRYGGIILPYDNGLYFEESMFITAFENGNYSAVEYFWRSMTDDQRKRTIKKLTSIVENRFHLSTPRNKFWVDSDRGLHYVIFLIKQFSFYQLDDSWFKALGCNYFLIQLLKWPYQDLFLNAVERSYEGIWKGCKFSRFLRDNVMTLWILDSIDSLHSTDGADSLYREIFHEIWRNFIRPRKFSINFMAVIMKFWSMREIGWLDDIINDECLEPLREFFLSDILSNIKTCVVESPESLDSAYLEEFIEKVLVSEEEREKFRTDIANYLGLPEQLLMTYIDLR